MILNKALICDLDGTLSNDENRVDLITTNNIDRYNKYAQFDKPNDWCVEIIQLFRRDGYKIFFLTGRSETMRDETITWISSHLPFLELDYALIMKTDADPVDVAEFKRFRYNSQILPDWDVLFVLEDRKKLVDMWRGLGLTCLQCADRI